MSLVSVKNILDKFAHTDTYTHYMLHKYGMILVLKRETYKKAWA